LGTELSGAARRWRWLLLVSSLVLIGVGIWAVVYASDGGWRRIQRQFGEITGAPGERPPGILQLETCLGSVDRCTTCHLALERSDLAGPDVPLPYRSHPLGTVHHLKYRFGCSVCHGGTGRALSARVAHSMQGTSNRDRRLGDPYIQASCSRCHVPGDKPGMERLLSGAKLYLELGCRLCHPLTRGGRGGWDFGPDLRAPGRKSLAYLEASLVDPTANFPRSTMPSFDKSFEDEPMLLEDMLIFLVSLSLSRPEAGKGVRHASDSLVGAACTDCHAGEDGRAGGLFRHECIYLLEQAQHLRCSTCHSGRAAGEQEGEKSCPVISEHRRNCWVCHDEIATGGGP